MKVVIVGGVAGGATAAARIRRLDEKAEITVFERSGYVSYANCGLPYYIGGVINDRRALTLQTPEGFKKRYGTDVRVHSEVIAIDAANKTVTVRETESGREYTESYDKLLLSPGAVPVMPVPAGRDGKRIFTLRTVEDTLKIRGFIDGEHPRSAIIAGGGYIGLEMWIVSAVCAVSLLVCLTVLRLVQRRRGAPKRRRHGPLAGFSGTRDGKTAFCCVSDYANPCKSCTNRKFIKKKMYKRRSI